ncbi:MAG: M48 family metallopeptidase [Pelagibacteraceae bacterium]|jgi:STE24 endopeptidase|nr:M48 family metallopeptidase [Candidatus Neomarinimicrobiota bacterium]MBT5416469.1 M48 family metallopeptidase [Cryomorphaceae bacterium]MBT6197340.1 M48 family metallopeptidase [Pelagibacteraceae bacterium]MBT6730309.1 M48 family metallopeptidase [Cryomorphaceae bacterium]MBT7575086.1 M48 family metallopeptidase [Flavobacteriaceae bacterium]
MTSEVWFLIIIGLVIFNFLFSNILDYLNHKNWKDEIPIELENFYDKEKYEKAKLYAISKSKAGLLSSIASFLFVISLLVFNGYGFLDQLVYSDNFNLFEPFDMNSSFAKSGVFFLILFILSSIISIPFSFYNTFVIEEKFGFNKTTKSTFFIDIIKSSILSILIGGFLLFIALYLYDNLKDGFWLWLWIGLSLLMVFINMFYADIIVPIFNKLTPLDNGGLRKKIENYSKEVGYLLKNIYVIDGSKRSTKANAFFSGLGPRKTIALYDTLIEKHTENELVAVLAHEIGHFKKKHVFSGLVMSVIQIGVMTFFFELCLKLPEISIALGGLDTSFHLGLIGFSIIFSPISMMSSILMNYISRKNEFEADAYAKETFNGEDLSLALKKLSVDSLSNIYPHPLYVFFHYSHPPLIQRLRALNV